jgi:hypothetical protein
MLRDTFLAADVSFSTPCQVTQAQAMHCAAKCIPGNASKTALVKTGSQIAAADGLCRLRRQEQVVRDEAQN